MRPMRWSRFLLAALLLGVSGCGVYENAVASYVIERQERIKTYEGTLTERGTVPGEPLVEVKERVRFVAPSDFVVEVLEPERYKGDTIAYLDGQLWLYSARSNSGLHVRNVPWSQERWRQWMRESIRSNREALDYEQGDSKVTVAGRVAVPWRVEPRAEARAAGLVSSRWWMDDEFTTTLRLEAGSFSFRFDEVAFNRPLERLTFEPPADAAFFEWDMAAPSVGIDEVRRYTRFPLLEPLDARGLERQKVIWSATDVAPVLALVYEKGPFFASIAENKDEGFRDPQARGIDVDLGGTKARLASIGTLGVLSFTLSGVQVTIVSNLPLHDLLPFARSLAAH